MLTILFPLSLIISVDDLRKLIEKSGQKFEASLFSESATLVASMDGDGEVSESRSQSQDISDHNFRNPDMNNLLRARKT